MEATLERATTPASLKCLIGLALGPLLFVLLLALPLELNRRAHRLAAVFIWAAVWWATEAAPVPITAILASVLCVILGIASAQTVLS